MHENACGLDQLTPLMHEERRYGNHFHHRRANNPKPNDLQAQARYLTAPCERPEINCF